MIPVKNKQAMIRRHICKGQQQRPENKIARSYDILKIGWKIGRSFEHPVITEHIQMVIQSVKNVKPWNCRKSHMNCYCKVRK